MLIDITVAGKPIKAVAVPGKQGFLYVFDRVTGKPVWPMVEKPGAAERCAGRENLQDPAVPDQAAGLFAPSTVYPEGSDRLHAGNAGKGGGR